MVSMRYSDKKDCDYLTATRMNEVRNEIFRESKICEDEITFDAGSFG